MIRFFFLILISGIFFEITYSQNAAEIFSPSSLKTEKGNSGIQIQKLSETEDVSCFLLCIHEDIKLHKHEIHSEHVMVVKGKAKMILGENEIRIRKGDLIFIPRNTPHSVTLLSKELKVISIQAPSYDGKDKVVLE